jgi:hypothetical protein
MFTQFYNESIRKLVIGFGTLFDNIYISHKNSDGTEKERVRIPISYGPKEKFIRRIQESSSISDNTKVHITLPRLGFDLLSIIYDPLRKTNKLRKRRTTPIDDDNQYKWNYNEVPYILSFGLYAFTRTMDDNLQIIEQIAPYFTPEFIVSLNINDINKRVDVPIVLNSISTVEDYEGDFDYRRSIISTFEFTAKTYVYGPEKTGKVILDSYVDLFGVTGDNWPSVTDQHTVRIRATGSTAGDRSDVFYE